jgi:hypothetical protein
VIGRINIKSYANVKKAINNGYLLNSSSVSLKELTGFKTQKYKVKMKKKEKN